MTKVQESVQDQWLDKVSVLYLELQSVSVHDQSSRIGPRSKMTRSFSPILSVVFSANSWPKLSPRPSVTWSFISRHQALHCFSPRPDATSNDKGSQGLHQKQTVRSTYLESTNLQHIMLLPSVTSRSWSPQQHAANMDVYLWDITTSNWKCGTSALQHSNTMTHGC